MGSTPWRADYPIRSMALSRDGKLLATVSEQRGVQLWDSRSGALLQTIPKRRHPTRVAFSHDAKAILFDGQCLDLGTGKVLYNFSDGNIDVPMILSPDGRWFASSMEDRLHCWSATDREIYLELDKTEDYIVGLAFHPKRRDELAAAHASGEVKVWDVATRKVKYHFQATRDETTCRIAYDPTGQHLTTVDRYGELKHWREGKQDRRLPDWPAYVRFLGYAPDGRLALTDNKGQIAMLDGTTGKTLVRWELPSQIIRELHFHPDGVQLYGIAFNSPVVYRWDSRTGKRLDVSVGHEGPIASMVAQPGGKLVTLGADRRVIRWHAGKETAAVRLSGRESTELSLYQLSPDGKRALSTESEWVPRSKDSSSFSSAEIRSGFSMHNAETGKQIHQMDFKYAYPTDIQNLVMDQRLPIGYVFIRGAIYTVHERYPQRSWVPYFRPNALTQASLFADGSRFVVAGQEGVEIIRMDDGKVEHHWEIKLKHAVSLIDHPPPLVQLSPDEKWVAICRVDMNQVILWNPTAPGLNRTLRVSSNPFAVQFSPDGHLLAVLHRERRQGNLHAPPTLSLIELATDRIVWEQTLAHTTDLVHFAPDEPILYTGGMDGLIYTWRFAPREASRDLAADWERLGKPEGYDAAWRLAQTPEAIAFLARKVHPSQALDPKAWESLLDDLDADDFEKRIQAERTLQKLGRSIAGMVRQSIASDPRLEVRRRLERLARSWQSDPDSLREARVIGILEQQRARGLLYRLGEGHPEADLTREARAALNRLQYQDSTTKEE
jgi:WD40 repeat protein